MQRDDDMRTNSNDLVVRSLTLATGSLIQSLCSVVGYGTIVKPLTVLDEGQSPATY